MSSIAHEQHYDPKQLAARWGLSDDTIRREFEDEPGVMKLGQPSRREGRKLKRRYYTMRIPHSVAERVHKRLTSR